MHSSSATPSAFRDPSRFRTDRQPEHTETPSRLTVALTAASTIFGLLVLMAGGYALTRPCAIGSCARLTEAETLTRNALSALETEKTTDSLVRARQEIEVAIEQLSPIPPWSLYHRESQSLSGRLQDRSVQLAETNEPLTLGMKAALRSQNPPHALREWREMERLWEQAIEQLETISAENPAYGFAQEKIEEYANNLEAVRRRAVLERRGEEQLQAAKSAADVARSRQSGVRGLEGWQQVYASWRTAVRALVRIPGGTTSATTAKQLFRAYGPQLTNAQQRQTQEQIAKNLYDRALKLADEAKTAQDNRQWDRAVVKWQQAIGYAQQIPKNTEYIDRSPALIRAYTNALVQAIAAQQLQENIDRAKTDLDRLCSGTPKICTYQVTAERIVVKLLPDYVNRVRELDIEALRQRNTEAQSQLQQHVRSFIDGLELVSLNAQIPLKVLNSDGQEVGSFTPTQE
ncbi:MAG: hypothetical protein J7641_22475 [Cyanobacteria bacterium SID2]|nr:hypothetical protein [Cyanobacteria bacterium SID2]MBP0005183.1 hypothetical protein [Cyanobacteria bacterium SBC]